MKVLASVFMGAAGWAQLGHGAMGMMVALEVPANSSQGVIPPVRDIPGRVWG